jgi:hypothetical protein
MSVIKDGVVCCDPDCWVSCSWAFKGMCHLHMHVFPYPWKTQDVLFRLAGCRIFVMFLVGKNPPLLILC